MAVFRPDFNTDLTKHMSRFSLPREAVGSAAIALFCVCTSASQATPQSGPTSAALNANPAIGWIKRAALPDDSTSGSHPYSTGIAARVVDAYGLGALGVVVEGPFVMPRWHVGTFHADSNPNRWHHVKQDELYPSRGQHVLFVWPEI